jgi:uncharacterized protein (TIGR02453 family)
MGRGFPNEGVEFLRDLAEHNNREWFQANKKRYEQELKEPSKRLAEAIAGLLKKIDRRHVIDPAKAVGRIFRDIRFSKDKTPYYTYVWFNFPLANGDRQAGAAYYVGIDTKEAGVGAGCWEPPPDRMQALRAKLAKQHGAFRKIVGDAKFAKRFGELQGDAYKRVPKPFPPDHPAADLLKLKGLHVTSKVPLKVATSDRFLDVIAEDFRLLAPMVAFLDKGLSS